MKKNRDNLLIKFTWRKGYQEEIINGVQIPFIKSIVKIDEDLPNIQKIQDPQFAEFSTIHMSHSQTKDNIEHIEGDKNSKNIFFAFLHQSGGGQSYHSIQYLWVSFRKTELLQLFRSYLQNEHRQEDCQQLQRDCICSEYINECVKELKETNSSSCDLVSGSGQGASISLYRVPLQNGNKKQKKIKKKSKNKIRRLKRMWIRNKNKKIKASQIEQ